MRRIRIKLLIVLSDRCTDAQAAEQALPTGRARAGGRVSSEGYVAKIHRAGGFLVVGADSHAPPIRAGALHQSPETSFVKPGSGTLFFRSVPSGTRRIHRAP